VINAWQAYVILRAREHAAAMKRAREEAGGKRYLTVAEMHAAAQARAKGRMR